MHRGNKEERVAVRGSPHDRLGADVGAGARRFSMMNGWPSRSITVGDQASDDVGPPPGGNGTIQCTGFVG